MSGHDDRSNGLLLIELMRTLGAKDTGNVGGFFDVPSDWRCPCCYRIKREIARIDKNGNLLCSIHRHHDHYCERFEVDVRKLSPGDFQFGRVVQDSLVRFADTLICNDCNVAEPTAKKLVGAPPYFTFSPIEIAFFIVVSREGEISVDPDRAKRAYDAAIPTMILLFERIQSITKAVDTGSDFEPLAASVGRVMSRLHANIINRKEAAE